MTFEGPPTFYADTDTRLFTNIARAPGKPVDERCKREEFSDEEIAKARALAETAIEASEMVHPDFGD